ncbi:MAG: cytochrome c biogenesis protein ResB [Holophaga sp.]|nr:cytochrome c biogenesis protein ResB [Holophaga sp.]
MIRRIALRCWTVLASLQVTIVALALLMALVVLCTLAQTELGTLGAVNTYMRSFLVFRWFRGLPFPLPLFPGGALVGLVLVVNLTAALIRRFEFTARKFGLWVVHAGLILLVAGEFVTGAFQVDTRMAIEQGQTVDFLESYNQMELAVSDVTNPGHSEEYGVPDKKLRPDAAIRLPGTPITLKIKRYYVNAELAPRGASDPPSLADQGVGPGVRVTEAAPATSDKEVNAATVFVEPVAGGRSYGTWLVSTVLGAPQSFIHEGRTYRLTMRPRRYYLPYSITLKKFSHDIYAGTDIPKNFSSLVHLSNPARGEQRDVLIYMNQPLRYDGKAFYQASYGKGDTLSILQVVANPGWLLPYLSCALITLGLLLHFGISLFNAIKRRQAQEAS